MIQKDLNKLVTYQVEIELTVQTCIPIDSTKKYIGPLLILKIILDSLL